MNWDKLDSVKYYDGSGTLLEKKYQFEYETSISFPRDDYDRKGYSFDHWGYYNGASNTGSPIPPNAPGPFSSILSGSANREPNPNYAQAGILKKITFPEGGTTSFIYEGNKIGSTAVGGVRIKQIKLKTGSETINKSFKYENEIGVSYVDPLFYYSRSAVRYSCLTGQYIYATYTYSSDVIADINLNGHPVTYSKVTEFLGDQATNSGAIEHYYDTRTLVTGLTPDFLAPSLVGIISFTNWSTMSQIDHFQNYPSYCNLNEIETIWKKSDGNTVKDLKRFYSNEIKGTYNGLHVRQHITDYQNHYKTNDFAYSTYSINQYEQRLDSAVTLVYGSGGEGPFITRENYTYNSYLLPSIYTTKNSDGRLTSVYYRYPFDINTAPYTYMVSGNMLNYIIEQYALNGNGYLSGGHLTTYKFDDGHYLPSVTYNLEPASPLTITSFKPFGRDYPYYPDINYKILLSFDDYNSEGNLLQSILCDGITTSYLWDLSGTYPMAEVKGATYSQISSLGGKACTYPSSDLWSSLTSMLSSAQVAAQVSTYSYKPLIGMASQTTPNGTTTRYVYDTFGRLYLTRDDDKNILARYRYGYQNNPDNGQGGYTAISASVSTGQTTYEPGSTGSATVTCTGGSGDFTYNWYLKNSSGTVLASKTNTTSTSFSFSCSESGYLTVQCDIADNSLMTSKTVTASINSAYAITMKPGYTKIVGEMSKSGTTISFYMAFYPTSVMQAGTYYLVATVSPSCRPLATRSITCTTDGRTWLITIYPSGEMYWKITSGSALNAYSAVGTPTLTYTL